MNLVSENALQKLFAILEAFTENLYSFVGSIIAFISTPIADLLNEFIYDDLPLGSIWGAPLRTIIGWLFPGDITIIGFIFSAGIAIYIMWNIASWIANIVS